MFFLGKKTPTKQGLVSSNLLKQDDWKYAMCNNNLVSSLSNHINYLQDHFYSCLICWQSSIQCKATDIHAVSGRTIKSSTRLVWKKINGYWKKRSTCVKWMKFQARSFFCCCSGFPERTSNICQCLRTRMLQRFDKEKLGAHAFVQNQSLS
jgi:hypothetical protein